MNEDFFPRIVHRCRKLTIAFCIINRTSHVQIIVRFINLHGKVIFPFLRSGGKENQLHISTYT